MASNTDSKIVKPAKPNLDVPPGIKVERQPAEFPGSDNKAGGQVPADRYTKSK